VNVTRYFAWSFMDNFEVGLPGGWEKEKAALLCVPQESCRREQFR
jgi:hypothetical protein